MFAPIPPQTKVVGTTAESSQVQSEFDRLQEELSGVEQYAMRYLEAERAHITSQELRLAEVCVLYCTQGKHSLLNILISSVS